MDVFTNSKLADSNFLADNCIMPAEATPPNLWKFALVDVLERKRFIKSFKTSDEVFEFIDDYKEENNKAYGDIFNEIAGAINDEGFFKSQMTKEEMEQKISNPLSGINMESLIKTSAEKIIGQLAEREIFSED